MAQYLVIKNNNNSTKQYECKDSPIGAPYLKVNNKAIDLTTKTSARFDLCVKPKVTSIKEQISSEYTYNTTDYNGFSGSALATITIGYSGYTSGNVTTNYSGISGYKGTVTHGAMTENYNRVNSTLNLHTYQTTTSTSSDYYASSSLTLPYTSTYSSKISISTQQTAFAYFTSPLVSSSSASGNTSLTTNINYAQKTYYVYVSLSSSGAWDFEGMFKTWYSEYNLPVIIYSTGASSNLYNTTAMVTTSNVYVTSNTTQSNWSSTGALTIRSFVATTKTDLNFLLNASNITKTTKRSSYGYSTATKTANTSMIFRLGLYSNKQLQKVSESTISYSGSIKTTSSYVQSLINFSGKTSIGASSYQTTGSLYTLLGDMSEIRYLTQYSSVPATSSYVNTIMNGTCTITSFYDSNADIPIPVYKGTGTVCQFELEDREAGAATYQNYGYSYTTTSYAYCSGSWRGVGGVGYPYTSYDGEYGIGNTTRVDWINQRATWSAWFIGSPPEYLLSGIYNYESASTTTSELYSTRRYCKFTISSSGYMFTTLTNQSDCKFRPDIIISSATATTYYYVTDNLSTYPCMYAFYDNGQNVNSFSLRYLQFNYATSSNYTTLKMTSANSNNMSNTYALIKTYNNNLGTTLITY